MDETTGFLDSPTSVCEQQLLPMGPGEKREPLPLSKPEKPTSKSTISAALWAYCEHMESRKMSAHTVKSYADDVAIFKKYLEQDRVVTNISKKNIDAFIDHLRYVKKESPKSVQRRISSLKHFFNYLYSEGAIPTNPAMLVACTKVVPTLPICLTESECLSLLSTAAKENTSDYLITYLLVDSGLKKNELLKAKVHDFDLSNPGKPEITVRYDKGQRIRNIGLSEEFGVKFETYAKNMDKGKVLFEITERDLTRRLKALAKKAGGSKEVNCQVLRDSSAVRRLKRGEDMKTVLKRLGLAYVKDIIKKYERLAPKAI